MKPAVRLVTEGPVSLRLVERKDIDMLLRWRNRDDARVWFKHSDVIPPADHLRWFEDYLERDDDFMFVAECSGIAVAQAAVYRVEPVQRQAEIGRFLAAPGMSGQGYVAKACAALLEWCARDLGLQYVYLDVKSENARAIHVYLRAGFLEESRSAGMVRMGLALRKPAGTV